MPVVESLPALVVLDKMYYSCCCAGLNVSLTTTTTTTTTTGSNKKKGRRGSSFLTRPFSHIRKLSPHFFRDTLISKRRALTLLLQKRVVVCLYLSLFLLFYCFSARGAKIYIERDERASLEPTRETEAIGVLFFY